MPLRILIIGGYGFFGSRLVKRLADDTRFLLIIAGRSVERARQEVAKNAGARARIDAAALDINAADLVEQLRNLGADVVVHTSGPFQQQDYRVARACLIAGCHYIDLADARAFVCGIDALDTEARERQRFIISGASSVPALSGAVIDHLSNKLERIEDIDFGISPANRTERGLATVAAVLSYCGKSIDMLADGKPHTFTGWLDTWQHQFPAPVGQRLMSPCDIPDLELLPRRYPTLRSLRFGAGQELRLLHRGINTMAWLARHGIVRDWSRHASILKWLSDRLLRFGTDTGGMHVSVSGPDSRGATKRYTWSLIATNNEGPFVPVLAAAALLRRFAADDLAFNGASPCLGILSLADFESEFQGLSIKTDIRDS